MTNPASLDRRMFLKVAFGAAVTGVSTPRPSLAARNQKGFMLATLLPTEELVAQVEYLAGLGANLIRFPVYLSYLPSINAWISRIVPVLSTCEARNVRLVLDLHHAGPLVWVNDHWESQILDNDAFVRFWERMAVQFRNRGDHLLYDLWNEPRSRTRDPRRPVTWQEIALRAARTIRARDSRHTIIYSVVGTTTRNVEQVRSVLPGIGNTMLQAHFYDFTRLQDPENTGQVRYPDASLGYTRARMEARLKALWSAGRRLRIPVYVGETAIRFDHPDAPLYLRDFTDLAGKYGIPLTLHAFREATVWNYENNPEAWQVVTDWLAR
jgi:hypothetical protein